jgi:hypothetical protein
MKTLKKLVWLTPLAFLIGCAAPVQQDHIIAEWQQNGFLPPTGMSNSRVYSQPQAYPATTPSIIVATDNGKTVAGDQALADSIRESLEFDRGLAPSLQRVIVEVQNGNVILHGSVSSDLDQRVIVDHLRDMAGVTRVTNNMRINPTMD